jgi:uncharacterized protein (TIGR00375 family)
MRIIADLHIHSKYSRATSPKMEIDNLYKWARLKGINLLGTGDFTHPAWLAELREKLAPLDNGLFYYKDSKVSKDKLVPSETYFILTTEISNIYSEKGRVRKIHNLITASSFEIVDKINKKLSTIGNLYADGRPILGLSSYDLARIVFDISSDCMIIPAHAWTPWFSIFGSNSGFDSIEECFRDLTPQIYAIETGLSSDPAMNWRLSSLDQITLVSNSDAHSLPKIGREANIFEIEEDKFSYNELVRIIREKDKEKFLFTVEFFPEEGKYHWDGHRACGVRLNPQSAKDHKLTCPKCGRSLTVGVMHRVEDLADRKAGFKPKNAISYKNLVPLLEIIAEVKDQEVGTKAVQNEYLDLIHKFGSEFNVLLDIKKNEMVGIDSRITEGIIKVRKRELDIEPGYDGVYGTVKVFGDEETEASEEIHQKPQMKLF